MSAFGAQFLGGNVPGGVGRIVVEFCRNACQGCSGLRIESGGIIGREMLYHGLRSLRSVWPQDFATATSLKAAPFHKRYWIVLLFKLIVVFLDSN
mmetsp:Transcript_23906/g.63260  ORF Transcript_23906/g.63260 Transcript_23906/m.63260 type:complete len:95 (-) Transcript_23906:113-397(-)